MCDCAFLCSSYRGIQHQHSGEAASHHRLGGGRPGLPHRRGRHHHRLQPVSQSRPLPHSNLHWRPNLSAQWENSENRSERLNLLFLLISLNQVSRKTQSRKLLARSSSATGDLESVQSLRVSHPPTTEADSRSLIHEGCSCGSSASTLNELKSFGSVNGPQEKIALPALNLEVLHAHLVPSRSLFFWCRCQDKEFDSQSEPLAGKLCNSLTRADV